jgi:hypothetical protein
MTTHTTHFLLNLFTAIVGATVPSVILGNSRGTAVPGLEMPAIGLGTGAYSNNPAVSGFFLHVVVFQRPLAKSPYITPLYQAGRVQWISGV